MIKHTKLWFKTFCITLIAIVLLTLGSCALDHGQIDDGKLNTYEIVFVFNDAEGNLVTEKAVEIVKGEKIRTSQIPLIKETLKREGYEVPESYEVYWVLLDEEKQPINLDPNADVNNLLNITNDLCDKDGKVYVQSAYRKLGASVTFFSNGGTPVKSIVDLKEGDSLAGHKPADPTKVGYTFVGWFNKELTEEFNWNTLLPKDGIDLYAKWEANDATEYVVEHYLEQLDGTYELEEAQELFAATDELVSAEALEYVGFAHNAGHAEAEEQGKVLADGSLVLKVFYSRNEYTVTFDAAGGVAKAEQTYKYGETLELGSTTKTGYTFLGWLLEGKELELDTMPAQDLELVADWMEGVGVQYKVEHYFEALDGSYVRDAKVETKVGKTGALVSAKVREVVGFEQNEDHKDALEQALILADGSLVLKVFYSRIEYTVSFDANGGSAKAEQVYKYGQTLALGETTKVGYTFVEWLYEGNQLVYATMPAQDLELVAKWTPNQDTLYSVEHYFEQLDGSYKLDAKVDELQAATEAKVTAVARVVEGFTHNPEHKDAYEVAYVLADGSLVLEVYYTRNEYTVSFDANGGVAKAEQTYLYGEELDLGVTTRTGYTFAGWAPKAPTTMPAEDLEFVAQWTANTNTAYKVQHYFEQLDGSYKLDATVDSLQGTTDTTVKAVARTVAGFTHEPEHANAKESANLNPDGSLVLSVYYSRNTYTLTINVDGVKEEVEYLFEETVEAVEDPEKTGYTFVGWSPVVPATMPAEDVEVVAEWTINQYTLTINIDGVKEKVVYDYNEAVEAIEDPEKTGYTFAGWSPKVPATMPAEDVEVVAEWTINQYQISFDLAGGYFKSMDEFADEIVELFKNSDEASSKVTTKETFHVNSHPNIKGVYNKAENLAAHKWLFEFALAEIIANCKANSVTEHVAETTEMLERMIAGDTTAIGDSYINGRSIFRHFIHNLINNNHESAGSTGGAYLPYTTDFSLVENQNRALAALNELVLTFDYNEIVVLPANPEKVGYTFAGWDPKVPTNMPAEDVELTATWTINQYTLTTNVDGVKKEIEYDYNETIVTPEAPTKVGYIFAGWKPAVPTNMPAQDVEVVAQWESIAYNISYDLDGANPLPFYNSYEEAVADFLKDYNAARGKSHTVETFSSLGSMTEIGAASLFLYNATYKAKWSWLVNYIATIAGSANKTAYQTFYNYNSQAELDAANSNNIYCIAYELRGWVGQIKYTQNGNFVSADYSQESIKSGCEALLIPTQYNVDSDTITLPTPVKAYHTFLGWFDEADNKVTEISKGSTGNIALTAKWQVNSYTFKYTIDGVEKEVEYNYGATIEKPANPTKVGYTFTGWSVAIPDTMPGHNIETEAQFTINSHNFTYVIDGVETTKSYQYGETIEYPTNPSKAGYTFEGWVGDKPVTMPDNDVTITAEFEVITYTITYNLAGGTNHANNPATYTVEDEITLLAPTKTDYDFLGWFDEEDQLVSVLNHATGDLVLTAKWDQNAYAISYDLNGGSWKEEEGAAKYSSLLGYELPLLVKEGYTFNGWYENAEFTGDAVTAIEIGTEGPKSFYAKFTIITYTVTFDSNEGSAVVDQNINHGSKAEKPADPTRNGYAFVKWQSNGEDYDFEAAVTGDLELVAVWELVTYTISYELNGGALYAMYDSYEDAVADFLSDYNTHYGRTHTTDTYSVLGAYEEISDAPNFLYNSKYRAKWTWLVNYLSTVTTGDSKNALSVFYNYNTTDELKTVGGNYHYNVAYELRAWVGKISYTRNQYFTTADYSQESIINGCENCLVPAEFDITSNEIVLHTPVKSDHIFLGWYDNSQFTGDPISAIVQNSYGHKTLYAQWISILDDAKNKAIAELDAYMLSDDIINGSHYETNSAELTAELATQKSLINNAESIDDVESALTTAKNTLIAIANPIAPTSISVDAISITPIAGASLALQLTFVGPEGYQKAVDYTSSNEEIATVKNGIVKFLTTGTVTITVTSAINNSVKGTIEFIVGAADVSTFVVETTAEEYSKLEQNGKNYYYGVNLFATITEAIAAAENGTIIVVNAGEYAEAITIDQSVTIKGPNAGVKGTEARNSEAIITKTFMINAENVVIDGIKFIDNGAIKVSANNVTIQNIYMSVSPISGQANNRTGCIVDGANITGLTIKNSYIKSAKTGSLSGIFAFTYVRNLIITGNYLTSISTNLYEAIMIYTMLGTNEISYNELYSVSIQGLMRIGNIAFGNSTSDTTLEIVGNTFGGSPDGNTAVSYLWFDKAPAKATDNIAIRGNVFMNFSTSTGCIRVADGLTYNMDVEYNIFDAKSTYVLRGTSTGVRTNNNLYFNVGNQGPDANKFTHANDLINSYKTEHPTESINWELITYTITYDLDGGMYNGETTIENATFTNIANVAIPTPVKDGYVFSGWYDESSNRITQLNLSYANYNLTAKWTEENAVETYTVTYNANGGIVSITSESFTDFSTIVLPTPDEREGYEFLGWSDGNGIIANLSENKDYALTAQWLKIVATNKNTGVNYDTISAAIEAASSGDTIEVHPGTYTENIEIAKTIKLISTNENTDPTVDDTNFLNENAAILTGILSIVSQTASNNTQISGLTFTGTARVFIYGPNSSNISGFKFTNNYVHNTTYSAKSYARDTSSYGYSDNSTSRAGFMNLGGLYGFVINPEISNNVFKNINDSAIEMKYVQNNKVKNNIFEGITYDAIRVGDAYGTCVYDGNTFKNVTLGAIFHQTYCGNYRSASTYTITNNIFDSVATYSSSPISTRIIGAIWSSGYGEKFAAEWFIKYNTFIDTPHSINLRDNVSDSEAWATKGINWECTVTYNAFINSETPSKYQENLHSSDSASTNTGNFLFDYNYYGVSEEESITVTSSQFTLISNESNSNNFTDYSTYKAAVVTAKAAE